MDNNVWSFSIILMKQIFYQEFLALEKRTRHVCIYIHTSIIYIISTYIYIIVHSLSTFGVKAFFFDLSVTFQLIIKLYYGL